MVSLWPFKGEATAADFEKILSTLAGKIQRTTARNDKLRQRSRRVKVLWTLYAGFAYILVALILTLVTGWRNWNASEITALAGSPVIIYGVRKALTVYYDYRLRNTHEYLESLHREREATIDKLKTATKYTSTQQLLEKYGSSSPPGKKEASTPERRAKQGETKPHSPQQSQPQRTNIRPPPTANIPRGPPPTANIPRGLPPLGLDSSHAVDQRMISPPLSPAQSQLLAHSQGPPPGAEFAPNAFSGAPQYSQEPKWYDRLLDALLGEDENQAKNRLALLCEHCRLINGLAPPGAKNAEDVGRWKCSSCGGWNGKESEAKKLVAQISQKANNSASTEEEIRPRDHESSHVVEPESEPIRLSPDTSEAEDEEPVESRTPAQSTRSRRKRT